MEIFFLIISLVGIIKDIFNIKRLNFSFLLRYFFVMFIFRNLEIFESNILNFFIVEAISIGTIIYFISYIVTGIIIRIFDIDDTAIRRIIYFFVYVIITFLLGGLMNLLASKGILPLF